MFALNREFVALTEKTATGELANWLKRKTLCHALVMLSR